MSQRQQALFTGLLITALAARSAMAGPPFVTDDPEPVEYQHWEIYLFSIYDHVGHSDAGQIPAVEVNYGVAPDFQLHMVAADNYVHDPGSTAHWGYGDMELGVKYRFVHETDSLPQIGTFPLVEAPTGNSGRGLGNGQTQIFAPVWLQKSFGPWTTFGGGGFWYNAGHDHRNYFRTGWELQRDLNEHLTLGGEVYHETPMVAGGHGHTALNLGGYYNINDHHHILFSAGRDIDGPIRFYTYLAYQVTF